MNNILDRILSRSAARALLLVILAIYVLSTLIYTIDADAVGIIQRFGKYVGTTQPGIHLKIPLGIDTVAEIPIQKVQKEEFGFRTLKAGVDSRYLGAENILKGEIDDQTLAALLSESGDRLTGSLRDNAVEILRREYLMLTGDLNVVDIEWIVQYNIKDAEAYLFNVREPRQAIRDCSQSVMRLIIGNGSVDEAITVGRLENEAAAKEMLQTMLDDYLTGIHIVAIKLQSANPPVRVRPAFNTVNEAMQQKDRKINEASEKYNEEVPKARGESEATVKRAEGYAIQRVNEAKGDVDKFTKIYAEYKNAPEITRQRMYLETMAILLPQLKEVKVIEQKGAEGGVLMNLKVND